jgi:hypothetical protein
MERGTVNMDNSTSILLFKIWAATLLIGACVSPLLLIWALNTFFPLLKIAYTFETWFAGLIVVGLLKNDIGLSNKK